MKDEIIYNKWTNFINDDKYKIYFQSNEKLWYESFNKVIEYINENKKRPSNHNKNIEIEKLAKWISHQQENCRNKKKIMKKFLKKLKGR